MRVQADESPPTRKLAVSEPAKAEDASPLGTLGSWGKEPSENMDPMKRRPRDWFHVVA
jgi:hypothetical protein